MELPLKRLPLKNWLQIFAVWTLAGISMATQMYLNNQSNASWLLIFLKQLPTWYLCALLTPVIIYFYEKYPLDNLNWKSNLLKQIFIALGVLSVFSHFRVFAMGFIIDRPIDNFTFTSYLLTYFSQMAWDFTIYSFVVTAIFADKNNTNRKLKELYAAKMELKNTELQNELKLAQLEALKLQLSPHFLFNTLNTISSLIRTGDYSTAIQINARLGDFLRTTLYSESSDFVSFKQEIEFVDHYLAIEKLRFKDRLTVTKNISQECMEVEVPHFILQPIIENAIKHGITKQSNAGLILIEAKLHEQTIVIGIFNEGKLLPENWIVEDNWGIGLSNVVNRLEKIYEDKKSFTIYNHPIRKGVEVQLRLPLKVPVK